MQQAALEATKLLQPEREGHHAKGHPVGSRLEELLHKEGYVVPTLPTACLHWRVQLHKLHAPPNITTSAQENPEGVKVALQSIVCAHVVPSRVIMCNCRCRYVAALGGLCTVATAQCVPPLVRAWSPAQQIGKAHHSCCKKPG